MKKLFITAAVMSAVCSGISAQDIHVAVDGNDDAAGTPEAPLASIEKAVALVNPGGTIYIMSIINI